jgi:hypothetical protein
MMGVGVSRMLMVSSISVLLLVVWVMMAVVRILCCLARVMAICWRCAAWSAWGGRS